MRREEMTEDEWFAKGYVKGYEDGLREAFDEIINIATKRSFTTTELILLTKNQRVSIPEKVAAKKRFILKKTGIDLNEAEGKEVVVESGWTPGTSLLIKERWPNRSYAIFVEAMHMGLVGLCISRSPYEEVVKRVGIEADICWLTKSETCNGVKEKCLPPTDLAALYTKIKTFLMSNKEKNTVILLEGFNYLVTNTNFLDVLKFVQKLKDDAYLFHSLFLITVDPSTLMVADLKMLENEMQNVIETRGSRE